MEQNLSFQINNFKGPLDLLLELIKERQMDIFDIDLVELTNQYLKLLETLKVSNINLASEYLVMATTLLHIKAKMLVNDPEQHQEVEQEKQDLLQQLVQYQEFKKISKVLQTKEDLRKKIFIKNPNSYQNFQYLVDKSHLDGRGSSAKMVKILKKMFERNHAHALNAVTVEKFNLSPEIRRQELIEILNNNSHPAFIDIFSVPTMNHFVVTFLTVLDMARKQELVICQNDQYEQITFKKGIINE